MRQKLFDNNPWKKDQDDFCYHNNRIDIYPFRQSIKIKNTKYNSENNYIDITTHIERLNNLAIAQNLLFVYHDFTGNDNIKYIEEYFMDNISMHLDHIIYGFGNGNITGCYYDFRKPESFFAYLCEENNGRNIIKVFSIQQIINIYKSLDNQTKEDISFLQFMNNIISIFPPDMLDIIMSQIKTFIDEFVIKFKNHIFTLFRYIYDIQIHINNNVEIVFDENFHVFNVFGIECKTKIIDLCKSYDINLFEKVKEIIAKKYKIELELMFSHKNQLTSYELINIITENQDKYKWCDTFNILIQ
jgi:hypothetical protein